MRGRAESRDEIGVTFAMKALVSAALAILVASAAPVVAASLKVVVFDIEPVDLPKTPEMVARLAAEGALLRKALTDKGLVVVDTAPQAKKIADNLPLSQCNGCDQDIARALGADLELATALQQLTSSTYNLSGSIKDVASNRVLRSGVVSITGDSADEWAHGVRFLAKERLLDPPLPADTAALKALTAGAPR